MESDQREEGTISPPHDPLPNIFIGFLTLPFVP